MLIAQGRDASDVPITQTFGPNTLVSFTVWTDEVPEGNVSCVIAAGLDPAIHHLFENASRRSMDTRVKPAYDAGLEMQN